MLRNEGRAATRADRAAPSCDGEEAAIAWNQKGVFSGSFSSPDGRFTISVSNAGIKLKVPSGHVKVAPAMIELTNAGALVRLTPGAVQLTGPLVKLNGCARGVARLADMYAGISAPGVSSGQIVSASTTVWTG